MTNTNTLITELNEEFGDLFSFKDENYFFGNIKLDVKEPTKFYIKQAIRPYVKDLLDVLLASDVLHVMDEDDFLDEIGEDTTRQHFNFKELSDYSDEELREELNDSGVLLPFNSIIDEFKIKHLVSVWDKYSDQDLERLLP